MTTIISDGHKIEIKGSPGEIIYYDDREVSNKFSIAGSTHVFRVKEAEVDVQYEVNLGSRWHGFSWWCEVRKLGVIIFTNK